ncbi:hypothetical protein ACHAXS_010812 [Conticribra weissflogii]
MPSANSSRQHPQRRIFRGRGGPTDGNIPRPKTPRIRVKYQHQPEDRGRGNHNDDVADGVHDSASLDVPAGQSPLLSNQQQSNGADVDSSSSSPPNLSPADEQFLKEIRHLRRRILNVTLAVQTSLGIANPKIWQENVLIPVKKVLREWRAILSFHYEERCSSNNDDNNDEIYDSPLDDAESSDNPINGSNSDTAEATMSTPKISPINTLDKRQEILSIYPQVFSLLQMSMQTGPLVGSNPGYFKRCGGDVAKIAFDFLTEVMDMADNDGSFDFDDNEDDGADVDVLLDGFEINKAEESLDEPNKIVDECKNGTAINCNAMPNEMAYYNNALNADEKTDVAREPLEIEETDEDLDEESENISTSESETGFQGKQPLVPRHHQGDEFSSHDDLDILAKHEGTTPNDENNSKSSPVITNLQKSYHFSMKQSRAIHTWLKNAQKAVEKNKNPSISAKRLQSQKGKKARMKELKKERQLKKKMKGKGKSG